MATIEGYSRLYLLKHWLTDVLGGYVFGLSLLAVFVYAGRALLDVDDVDEVDDALPAQGAGAATPPALTDFHGPYAV
jgi:membrane-associated phospholipid phosphatase